MMNHESKRPVVLEDLLRLKRAERPSAEFWVQFDRELRAKQLAALVEKRPWWSALPRAFAGISRYHLPLGATAVLALSIISVREFQSNSPAQPGLVKAEAVAVVSVPAAPETAPVALANGVGSPSMAIDQVAAVEVSGVDARVASLSLDDGSAVAAEANEASPVEEATLATGLSGRQSAPSVRSLGGTLVALRGAEAAFAREVLTAQRGSDNRLIASTKPRVDPLAQMTPPTEARRSSLFNASFARSYAPAARSAASRATSRLSDEQLYDSVSRFVASGNSLGAKF